MDEIERLRPHLTPESRVLIIGAHVGTLAIPVSKLCREVVALEANPNTYELLAMNVKLNSVSNCRVIQIAASDKQESLEFLMNRANSGGSKRVPKVHRYSYYYDKPQSVSVRAVRLDQFLEGERFNIAVIDIEGSEYFALKGMTRILSQCELFIVEFMPQHLREVSGITPEQFISVIAPHFSRLTIPSKQRVVTADGFVDQLQAMYDLDQGHAGILFEKI
ncbi:MAG: FkbM family methyltransferase [Bacteroidota bacterium]